MKTFLNITGVIIKKILALLFLFVLCSVYLFGFVLSANASNVSFTKRGYSDVFDDLREDVSFKAEYFPNMTLDYFNSLNMDNDPSNDQSFMEIITIAESYTNELYLYIYQPTDTELDIEATAVSISIGFSADGQNLKPKIYNLELVSSYNVFDKYVVKNFVVPKEIYRYYNIVSLYRNYNEQIDDLPVGGEASGSEIGMRVGQQWCAYFLNDKIVYEKNTFETIEIKINCTGNVRFENGITWGSLVGFQGNGDAWFIAFDCKEYIIKRIYDADLSYKIQDYSWDSGINVADKNETFGEWSEDIPITLKNIDRVEFKGEGLFSREYSYNRIMTSQSFVDYMSKQGVKIDNSVKTSLNESQWVFTFKETPLNVFKGVSGWEHYEGKNIDDVTVLRMHFADIKGKVFNLGVISDRVNPDNVPDGVGTMDILDSLKEFFQKLFAILGVVVLVLVLMFFSNLLSPVIIILKTIWNVIKYIINLPIKIIKWIF